MHKNLSSLLVMALAIAATLLSACSKEYNDNLELPIEPEKAAAERIVVTFAVAPDIANLWDITAEYADVNGIMQTVEMPKTPTMVETGNGSAEMCVINISEETISVPIALDVKVTYTRNDAKPGGANIDGSFMILKQAYAIDSKGETVGIRYRNIDYKRLSYPVGKIGELLNQLDRHSEISIRVDKYGNVI